MGTTNDNHCNIYLMSLLLTVVINIWGVNCDIKTDFPKSSHNYTLGIYMYLRTKQDQKLFVRHVRVIMVNIAQLNAI